MSDNGFSTTTVIQIWNDRTGERVEVGEDRDGLGLAEIRYYSDDGKMDQSITLNQNQAIMVADALRKLFGGEP